MCVGLLAYGKGAAEHERHSSYSSGAEQTADLQGEACDG